jgi:23S rRNA (guanosine2251-2'-O)-methyltransferase
MKKNTSYIFGIHAVAALLDKQASRIIRLCVQKERHDKKIQTLIQSAKNQSVLVELISRQELNSLTDEANHQGIVAFCQQAISYSENELSALLQNAAEPPLILILDGVQDPHNLGACFRSADAFGVTCIIAPKDKSVGITPVVSKVASGAVDTIPFISVTNLVRVMEQLKELGLWIYGATGEATQSLYQSDLTGPAAIVLGSEGSGIRRLTREHCDVLINIPMLGTVSSLNVSVATGIFLFEAARQRSPHRR